MDVMDDDDFSKLLSEYQTASTQNKQGNMGCDSYANRGSNNNRFQGQNNRFQGQNNRSNGAHKCKTCNIGYTSREMLFDHLSTHIQCDEEGCDFVGVPPMVSKHKKEEHVDESKESVQVFSMEHPEILHGWLEQRRKNFPSSGNIKLKQLREQTKIDRGIIAKDKSFTFKGKWGVKRHQPCLPEDDKKKRKKEEESSNSHHDPLSFILGSEQTPKLKPSLVGLAAYDSSSDSEPDANKPAPPKPATDVKQALKKFQRYAKIRSAEGTRRKERFKWNGVMKSGRRRFQPTLLYRLLAKEITNEHNLVLQSIRYIVSRNFFKPVQSVDAPSKAHGEAPSAASTAAAPAETPAEASTAAGPAEVSTAAGPAEASTAAPPAEASTAAAPAEASTAAAPAEASTAETPAAAEASTAAPPAEASTAAASAEASTAAASAESSTETAAKASTEAHATESGTVDNITDNTGENTEGNPLR